ncbi:MAG TPA: hypothetical protein VK463_15420 [Desulfomonilaceae bacterium]|nr:hypothetical protein [Desulfomonilaceae bacterium]
MKRPLVSFFVILVVGLVSGCAYFQKKDEPPPLPVIEETKPPLKLKGEYFKEFPWSDLAKPRKDGNDPDTRTYTAREGDTFQSIAENEMGDPALGAKLASFNDASDMTKPAAGEKIVIPNPIVGMSSQIEVKHKGEKQYGPPEPFDTALKKGDEYKLRFESNDNGYTYVFRQSPKGLEMLYPAQVKKGKRNKKAEPLIRDTGKIMAHDPITVPAGPKGFAYDPKRPGDQVFVFLSLRKIPELEDLKEKTKIGDKDVEEIMRRVKEGEIVTEGPVRVLRIADPAEILGFSLNLNG